jgi:hypothetical protein
VRGLPPLAPGGVVLALVSATAALAWRDGMPAAASGGGVASGESAWLFLALLVAAFAAYLIGLAAVGRARGAHLLRGVCALAVAVQLAPLAAPLLLSTDGWTYWSYGWIGAKGGGNPYSDPPLEFEANPALPHMGAAWLATTSVYGPAFTLASEPIALAAGESPDAAAWIFKALAAAAAVAAALVAGRLVRRRALAVAFVGWNPILAVHLAGGGHNDAWVGALLVCALALAAVSRLDAAGGLWALAVLVKWIPLVFVVLRALEARATGRATRHAGFGLAVVAVLGIASWRYGPAWVEAIAPLAGNAARETSYALPARLEQLGAPKGLALGLAAAALASGLVWLARAALRGRARLGLAGCLLLLTTPYLVVWYLGWVVPLAAVDEDDRLARAVCLALCGYLLPQTIPT